MSSEEVLLIARTSCEATQYFALYDPVINEMLYFKVMCYHATCFSRISNDDNVLPFQSLINRNTELSIIASYWRTAA
jgi:hypothetical protein